MRLVSCDRADLEPHRTHAVRVVFDGDLVTLACDCGATVLLRPYITVPPEASVTVDVEPLTL